MIDQYKIQTEDLVILVHGTFASTDKGWASEKSEFAFKLAKYYFDLSGSYFNFTTFKWNGLNSLYERQSAATNLAETININHSNFKRIHFIGHSHGGTVIQFALQQEPFLVSNNWKTKVASWTTIGTPFYRYKGYWKLTDKNVFQISMPASAILIVLLGIIFSNHIAYKILFFLLYIPIFAVINSILNARSLQYKLDIYNNYFVKKWFGVYSKYDEAIVGLANYINFKIPTPKRELPSMDSDFNLVTYLGKCLNTLFYNYVTRKTIIPFVSDKLRSMGLGLDRLFYDVREVVYTPIENAKVQPIPENIENELIEEVIKDNQQKIAVFRKLLNLHNESLVDMITKIPEIDQPKIVHSLYFKNESVIKAIANHISTMNKNS